MSLFRGVLVECEKQGFSSLFQGLMRLNFWNMIETRAAVSEILISHRHHTAQLTLVSEGVDGG